MEQHSDGEVVELDVTVTFQDLLRFSRWHACHRRPASLAALALLFVCAGVAVGLRVSEGRPLDWRFWVAAAVTLTVMYGLVYVVWLIRVRRVYASHQRLAGPTHYVFAHDGIAMKGPHSSGRVEWTAYWQVGESKTDFWLYLSRNLAHMVPKRCFTSSEQIERFRQILRSSLPSDRVRIRST